MAEQQQRHRRRRADSEKPSQVHSPLAKAKPLQPKNVGRNCSQSVTGRGKAFTNSFPLAVAMPLQTTDVKKRTTLASTHKSHKSNKSQKSCKHASVKPVQTGSDQNKRPRMKSAGMTLNLAQAPCPTVTSRSARGIQLRILPPPRHACQICQMQQTCVPRVHANHSYGQHAHRLDPDHSTPSTCDAPTTPKIPNIPNNFKNLGSCNGPDIQCNSTILNSTTDLIGDITPQADVTPIHNGATGLPRRHNAPKMLIKTIPNIRNTPNLSKNTKTGKKSNQKLKQKKHKKQPKFDKNAKKTRSKPRRNNMDTNTHRVHSHSQRPSSRSVNRKQSKNTQISVSSRKNRTNTVPSRGNKNICTTGTLKLQLSHPTFELPQAQKLVTHSKARPRSMTTNTSIRVTFLNDLNGTSCERSRSPSDEFSDASRMSRMSVVSDAELPDTPQVSDTPFESIPLKPDVNDTCTHVHSDIEVFTFPTCREQARAHHRHTRHGQRKQKRSEKTRKKSDKEHSIDQNEKSNKIDETHLKYLKKDLNDAESSEIVWNETRESIVAKVAYMRKKRPPRDIVSFLSMRQNKKYLLARTLPTLPICYKIIFESRPLGFSVNTLGDCNAYVLGVTDAKYTDKIEIGSQIVSVDGDVVVGMNWQTLRMILKETKLPLVIVFAKSKARERKTKENVFDECYNTYLKCQRQMNNV